MTHEEWSLARLRLFEEDSTMREVLENDLDLWIGNIRRNPRIGNLIESAGDCGIYEYTVRDVVIQYAVSFMNRKIILFRVLPAADREMSTGQKLADIGHARRPSRSTCYA